jgi:hypothetical protein
MSDLFYKMKSKVISFLADIRIYWFGFILFGQSSYKIKGPHMRHIINTLEPGDILLRRYDHYLGSVAVSGYFSHAAIYVGDNRIIHMLGDGVCEEDILTFMRCDDIAILRESSQVTKESAIEKAENFLVSGVEYDFDFDNDTVNRMYCTEFIDNCFGYPVKCMKGANKKILPDDFLDVKSFRVVWRKR